MKIKNTSWTSKMFIFAIAALFMASCDDLEDITLTDLELEEALLIYPNLDVTDDNGSSVEVFASDYQDSTFFNVLVTFTSSDDNMQRLYMTENRLGAGDEVYDIDFASFDGLDLKGDNSIDLSGSLDGGFSFVLPFPIEEIEAGTVVYTLWATSGRGDHRENTKRLTVGLGTIEVNYSDDNPATVVKEYTQKVFAVPTESQTSESFISLVDGMLYEIAAGEEYAALWDFGYYYGASGDSKDDDASFASISAYEDSFEFIDVDGIAGTTELNNFFFAESSMVFEDVTVSSDLDGIVIPSSQNITNLAEGDVIEFADNYGNKGLIEVSELFLGASGNGYDSDAFIKINIKVQP